MKVTLIMKKIENPQVLAINPDFAGKGIEITHDDLDERYGIYHRFTIKKDGVVVGELQFQHGPVSAPDAIPGLQAHELLEILVDQLEHFSVKWPTNKDALGHLKKAMEVDEARTLERRARKVEGTNAQ